jgi:AcrR family transcriptional regulator
LGFYAYDGSAMGKTGTTTGRDSTDRRSTTDAVATPWGDASTLRNRKLRPGPHGGAAAARNQKERLFAAIVAEVAGQGYEATTVADLVERSGVSRSTFYSHFDDKEHCFLAAVDALTGPALERLAEQSVPIDDAAGRAEFERLIELIVAQPAAAKTCLVEVYAAGPRAAAQLQRIVDGLTRVATRMFEGTPDRQGMPPEIVRAIVGGVQKAIYKRLLRGEEAELPGLVPRLWEWVLCIPPPPGPLTPSRRRSVRPRRFEERQAASQPVERVLRAMAAEVSERGYAAATVAEIVERAHTSQRTFYESFADKEAAMVAALDSGSAQMLAAALPAFRRATDWPGSVRDTQEAMLRFAAEEPEYGRLGAVAAYQAGARALEQREIVTESMEQLLAAGFQLAPDTPPLAPEAIGGALYAMLYDFVEDKGPERLLELVPTFAYVTLAPFLGAEDAYAVAVG